MAVVARAPAADDRSLARMAPKDTGLFVELYRAEDLLIPLTEPHVWITLADLAGQPANEADAAEWRERIRQTVQMDPAQAIRVLFARRAAFIGQGPGRAQDAVVLCRPAPSANIPELLSRWSPTKHPGKGEPDVYTLRNNVGLAVHDGSLVFGDASAGGRMFGRVIEGLKDARSEKLADDPVFAGLLRRVPPDPDGILFARLSEAAPSLTPASAPASQATAIDAVRTAMPELPGPFRKASNLLMALHREKNLLHFTAVATGGTPTAAGSDTLAAQVRSMPARSLFASGGHVDYPALIAAADKLPNRNVFRMAINLQNRLPNPPLQPLIQSLDSATSVAIGVVSPKGRAEGAPPLPALGAVILTRDPQAAGEDFDQLIGTIVDVYNLVSFADPEAPRLEKAQAIRTAGVDAKLLDLSPILKKFDKPNLIGELHLCWAIDGEALVVASHREWLEEIVRARRGETPNLSDVFKLAPRPAPPRSDTLMVFQTGPIADLCATWLDHLKTSMPHVLTESYWRGRQPGGLVVKLGIAGDVNEERRSLKVTSVEEGSPADGFLRDGDELVGINSHRFATTQPVQEFHEGMMQRPNARWVDVTVRRDDVDAVVRVPLPFVDPIEAVRRARAIGKVVQRILYYDDVPDPAGPRGFLTVELRQSEQPLFDFAAPPAVQPIGTAEDNP